ncbi:hypothetical protein QYF36_018680 [Acer negundo]|nr:hypothetical protein QYF36_018680 [Acer negundo]
MGSGKLILMCSKFVLSIQPQLSDRLVFRSHDCRTLFLPRCLLTITPSGQLPRSPHLPSSYSPFNYWHKWQYPHCPLPQRYTKGQLMATIATAEACDSNAALLASHDLRVLQPVFQIYGQSRVFSGPIVTVKVFEDNVLVRELIESRGDRKVLVIDGGDSMRCALVGGNLAQLAHNNGWVGIVVNGCIRDVDEINACGIGVRALGSHPMKSYKKGHGEKHGPVHIAGTFIHEGEWLYADSDGILVSATELSV